MENINHIIKLCKQMDKHAQKALYDAYAPILLGICMRYANSKAEAEDILQDGFVKIFINIKQYKESGSFEGWLKRIIVNTSITYLRLNKKRFYHLEISDIQDNTYVNANINSDYTHAELLQTIRELPDGYKAIFNLFAIEGYSHKEIAGLLNIDVGTSKSQYSRAKKLLRKKLEKLSVEKIQIEKR